MDTLEKNSVDLLIMKEIRLSEYKYYSFIFEEQKGHK